MGKRVNTTANANAAAKAIITAMAMVIATITAMFATTTNANAQTATVEWGFPVSGNVNAGSTIGFAVDYSENVAAATVAPEDFALRLFEGGSSTGTPVIIVNQASQVIRNNARSLNVRFTVPTTRVYGATDRLALVYGRDTTTLTFNSNPVGMAGAFVQPDTSDPTMNAGATFTPISPNMATVTRVDSSGNPLTTDTATRGDTLRWRVVFTRQTPGFNSGDVRVAEGNDLTGTLIAAGNVTVTADATVTPANTQFIVSAPIPNPATGFDDGDVMVLVVARPSIAPLPNPSHGINGYRRDRHDPLHSASTSSNIQDSTRYLYTPPPPAAATPQIMFVGLEGPNESEARFRVTRTAGNYDFSTLEAADFRCTTTASTPVDRTIIIVPGTVTSSSLDFVCVHELVLGNTSGFRRRVGFVQSRHTALNFADPTFTDDGSPTTSSTASDSALFREWVFTPMATSDIATTFTFVRYEGTDAATARFRLTRTSGDANLFRLQASNFRCEGGASFANDLSPTIATFPVATSTSIDILCDHGITMGSMGSIRVGFTTSAPTGYATPTFATNTGATLTTAMGTARPYELTPAIPAVTATVTRVADADGTPTSNSQVTAGTTVYWQIAFSREYAFTTFTNANVNVVTSADITAMSLSTVLSNPLRTHVNFDSTGQTATHFIVQTQLPSTLSSGDVVGIAVEGTIPNFASSDGQAFSSAGTSFATTETYTIATTGGGGGTPAPMPTAPTVSSVVRASSASADTMGGDVTWTVTFSEGVRNVSNGDFEAFNQSGATMLEVATTVTMTSATVYEVTATLPGSGYSTAHTVGLRLARDSADHGIEATATGNTAYAADDEDPLLSANYGSATNQTYRLMSPAGPTLLSLTPDATTGVFTARFSQDVMGVDASSFELGPTGTTLTIMSVTPDSTTSADEFMITLSGMGYAELSLSSTATTTIMNAMNVALSASTVRGVRLGMVSSITNDIAGNRPSSATGDDANNPAGNVESITWTVTYDSPVPDASMINYSLLCARATGSGSCSYGGSLTATTDSTNAAVHTIVAEGSGFRSLVANYTLSGSSSVSNSFASVSGAIVHLDTVSPSVTQGLRVDSNNDRLYTIVFSEDVVGLALANFQIDGMAVTSSQLSISGSGTSWSVTLMSSVTGTLSFVSSAVDMSGAVMGGTDLAGNPISATSNSVIIAQTMELIVSQISTTAQTYVSSTPNLVTRIRTSPIRPTAPSATSSATSGTTTSGTSRPSAPSATSGTATTSGDTSGTTTPTDTGTGTTTGDTDSDSDTQNNFAMSSDGSTMSMNYSLSHSLGNNYFSFSSTETSERIDYSASLSLSDLLDSLAGSILDGSPSSGSRGSSTIRSASSPSDSLLSDLGFWLQGTYTSFDDSVTDSDGNSYLVHMGVDSDIGANFIAGIMLQLDQTERATPSRSNVVGSVASDFEGSGWLLGPYIAGRAYNYSFSMEGRLSYGGSSNEIMYVSQPTSSYDTERLLASLEFSGIAIYDISGWDMGSSLEYSYYSETSDSFMGLSGTMIPSSEYVLHRLSFGPSLTRTYYYGDGSVMVPTLSFSGLYNSSDDTTTDDFTGKFDMGFSFTGRSGLDMNVGGYYDGIGSDLTSYGITGGIRFSF